MKRRARKAGRNRSQTITLAPPRPFNGDHGTGTAAALAGTVLEAVEGDNPNHVGRRRRECVIGTLSLTMRQEQAAKAIRDAYCRVEMLSSGSPLKETVDTTSRPDATIAKHVDAMSQLTRAMRAVTTADRSLVEHICWHNQPGRTSKVVRWSERFKSCMDKVADHLRY